MQAENENKSKPSRLQRLKEKSKGTVKFSFIFFSLIHLATVVVAAIYYEKCPVESNIPKFLLIIGILGAITKLITLSKDFLARYTKVAPLLSFVTSVELTIFIVESYYVYREFRPNYDPLSGAAYCNKTLYLFSFIYITIVYSLLLLCVVSIICFISGLVLLDRLSAEDKETHPESTTEVPLSPDHASDEKK